jgi:gamma-glutamyltranspeptidase/glutathione hydrolase
MIKHRISLGLLFLYSSLSVTFAMAALPASSKLGMVASEQHLASDIGANILRHGGNAIDAAVAVGYALAVVNPCCGNIGGGGFMTLHLASGKNIFINFRERAPFAAKSNMFLDASGNLIPEKSTVGYLAVATPGTVLGLETARKKYGTFSREKLIAPAIQLAEKGYILTAGDIKLLNAHIADFKKQPNVAAIFLKNNQPYQIGDRLIQTDLANSLKLILKDGTEAFYKGKLAEKIVKASQQNQGILSMKDFAGYTVTELTPITCSYHGYTIISAPPPSSGGVTLCEMLNILESYPLKKLGFHSAMSTHIIVEAMRHSFYDRNMDLGDPDFVKNPVARLISKDYATTIRTQIKSNYATPSNELGHKTPTHEGMHTTHYSVTDKFGNAVSVTYTLNSFFGAQIIAGDTGFFLNNEMDDFAAKPGDKNQFGLIQGAANAIVPGKRPLSSMTPTIITKKGQVVMVVGCPGGPRIITATMEAILNTLDYQMNIQDAINAPRFHHQWYPDSIDIEPNAFSSGTLKQLSKMGYQIVPHDSWGAVEAIYIDPMTHIHYGANDIRRAAGKAMGY